jgi:hypothetical protein
MTAPWVPHRVADRERLAPLVEKYGHPAYPPRAEDRTWAGGTEVTTRDGWYRCLWCDTVLTHANKDHDDACPVGRQQRTERLLWQWPVALKELRRAIERRQHLLNEAAKLGISLPEDPVDTPPKELP